MFGTLRTILALLVLVGHIGGYNRMGTYAVFAFYIISGYLMTLIMHESYGYSAVGRARFALNRFLRLYPVYWVALLFSAAVIYWSGERFALSYEKHMYFPASIGEYASVLSMIYAGVFPNKVAPNILPASWAITVELFFYVLICLGLSKTKRRVWVWLIVSAAWPVYCHVASLAWTYKYYPIAAGSLPFALGALIYFFKSEGYPSISDSWITSPAFLSMLLMVNSVVYIFKPWYFQTGFYVSLFISILLVFEIAAGREWSLFGWRLSRNIDKKIGDYSYPIYLLHWPVGLLLAKVIMDRSTQTLNGDGFTVLLCSIVLVFLVAHLVLAVVARPVERIRARIKSN